jgi:triphosphoribosyl-dephospho-CoA synthase
MIYGQDVSHVVTEEGIAYLFKTEGVEERRRALAVLYRGGPEAQRIVHEGAARVIKVGGPGSPKGNAALIALGQELVSLRISPGDSADLLAATLFLDALERGLAGVEKGNSLVEENNGAN